MLSPTILFIVGIVVALLIILVITRFAISRRRQPLIHVRTTEEPMVQNNPFTNSPTTRTLIHPETRARYHAAPTQPTLPTQPNQVPPSTTPRIVILEIRRPLNVDTTELTTPPDPAMGRSIRIPTTTTIKLGQKTCIVCQHDITYSYANTGWVRCQQSGKLVHGHCHTYNMHGKQTNWCSVCGTICKSNLAMGVEGIQ